jgi:hypothetical protein
MGLFGLQYREFFSFLLPHYESVGVSRCSCGLTMKMAPRSDQGAISNT